MTNFLPATNVLMMDSALVVKASTVAVAAGVC